MRGTQPAALRADHQGDALSGEGVPAIQAGERNWNLGAQARATPRRFGCNDFHPPPQNSALTSVAEKGPGSALEIVNESNAGNVGCAEVETGGVLPHALSAATCPVKMARHSQSQLMRGISVPSVERPALATAVEWKVLLAACAGAENDLRGLLGVHPDADFDWGRALQLAEDHGISLLLYRNLKGMKDAIPSSVLETLRERYETNVHRALLLTRQLIRVLDLLDGLGIDAISYKGVVLSESHYGDIAMRVAGDIDLFVRKNDVDRIKNAVRELGYTPRVEIPKDAEKDHKASGYECSFDSPAGRNLLEIQWALQPRFYAVDYDMDELFERTVKTTVGGRSVKRLAAEDLLLVLAVHGAKHAWGKLIWLCDIAQILQREELDWELVQSRAQDLGVERILLITMELTNRFLGATIPVEIERSAAKDRAAKVLAEEIAVAVEAGVSYGEEQVSYFRLMMRLRERRVDRLRFLTRLTFTPGPGEWNAMRLPKVMFPFYRVVRLGRLAARVARG